MIDRERLLADLQRLLKALESDLRERCDTNPQVDAPVREEYERARAASRTAQAYDIWREDHLTQAAVAWILACVFVRFLEDNDLVDAPRLAGPGDRLALARDHHTVYISQHPTETDREYLLSVFRGTAKLPAMSPLLDERHNPLFRLGLSADGARMLLEFWQKIDPGTGALVYDFTDPTWSTRFLGDLYQDLSETARKTYALLQTPEFVEEFILDRTLEPAIQEFGYQAVRLIDLACGSGHFLLGAFRRLFERWVRDEPGTNPRALAQRTLDALSGVDLNPFAVAIARFRLLIAALQACDVHRLADAPGFKINLAVGDSLLHGPRPRTAGRGGPTADLFHDALKHVYETEDAAELTRILGQPYHVVVGNPPYITPKDSALNQAYRDRFGSCHRQYSLAVPFMERFFDLAIAPEPGALSPAGFVGMITANSFMKREFGKKLIEQFIPRWDLTHVVDTSGAYIPGHGTPTVILFARHRAPVASTLRAVLGIRGEPQTPDDPAKGLVWSTIVDQIDRPGSQSDFVSVADMPRERFHLHPWSIGGGGAAELKAALDETARATLRSRGVDIGFLVITGEDNCFLLEPGVARRHKLRQVKPIGDGEAIRDWICGPSLVTLWPNDERGQQLSPPEIATLLEFLWPYRTSLKNRKAFGIPIEERGIQWWALRELYSQRLEPPLSISFAFVATHNHFILDRGGKVFKQSAPVIKLPGGASEDDHLGLLGLLNSSTACFWMKQIFYPKATVAGDVSIEKGKPEGNRYEFAATGLLSFPVPSGDWSALRELARLLDTLAAEKQVVEPAQVIQASVKDAAVLTRALREGAERSRLLQRRMVALQEELDWEVYRLFGLTEHGSDSSIVEAREGGIDPEERPYCSAQDAPPATLPFGASRMYVVRRGLVASDERLALIEDAVYKRPWLGQQGVFGHATSTYSDRIQDACATWLLDRLEDGRYWPELRLTSSARLADRVREDAEFMQLAELYRGRGDFDVTRLVTELVEAEAVPFLPVLRYTPTGMQKRRAWEECWALQRREDAGEAVGEISVPPKYASGDFKKGTYWRLRGKLDVPKERFVLYAHAERATDPTPVLAWAGWDALQQAQALAAYFIDMKESEGWSPERLTPLLAGLLELLPWLRQRHNDVDPETRLRMGDYFAQFLDEEARALGLTLEDVRLWAPLAGQTGRRRRTPR